ncbi:MAG: hypothetical protein NZ898_16835, partial [Myxococcota bacterium]|nr:hypothetical protein [Myxococcota bacterium]
ALDEDSGALEAATGAEPRTPTRRARGASGCACRTNRGRISSDVLHAVLVAAIGLLVRLRRTGFAQDPTR